MNLLWLLVSFLIGSIPFSCWIGSLVTDRDIREIGDGNPGAANVFRTGNMGAGIVALLLDYLKGFLPVYLLKVLIADNSVALIGLSIAPIVGHAFSPFLKGKGGKAITVSFGIWSGLTLWVVPTVWGISLIVLTVFMTVSSNGWRALLGFLIVPIALLIMQPDISLWIIYFANLCVLIYKQRKELSLPLRIHFKYRRS